MLVLLGQIMFDKEKMKAKREQEVQDSLNLWNTVIESQEKKEEQDDKKKDKKDKK